MTALVATLALVVGATTPQAEVPEAADAPQPADTQPAAPSAADAAAQESAEPAQPDPSEDEDAPVSVSQDEDRMAVFALNRGFYFASDLGVFFSFGGVNGVSNVQPYVAIKAGFDIGDHFGLQLSMSNGFVANNPLTERDTLGGGGEDVVSYGLFSMGAEGVFVLRPTSRFAIEPRIGAGVTRISPAPTDPSDGEGLVGTMNPHIAYGADFKYLTLMSHFTAGLSLSGYYVLGPNIPALGVGLNVRYTF